MNITNVQNPVYITADHREIMCEVTIETIGTVPFMASANDTEAHGTQLYADLVSGKYGTVAAYVAPPPYTKQPSVKTPPSSSSPNVI